MKKINFDVDVSDEDWKSFKNGDMHLRIYYVKEGDVACVTVPKEEQDLLDRGIISNIALNFVMRGISN